MLPITSLSLPSAIIGAIAFLSTPFAAYGQSVEEIANQLERKTVEYDGRFFPTARLKGAYELRGFAPIWMRNGVLTSAGEELVDELTNSYRDGLDPSEYLAGIRGFTETQIDDSDAAGLELALSNAFLKFGLDLYSGFTTPSVTDPNIVIKRKKLNAVQWLEGAATNGAAEMYRALRPSHPQYAQIRQMLAGYRSLLLRGGWEKISEGATLKPGMSDPRVAEMRANLAARGYDNLDVPDLNFYDDGLKSVVVHFQRRHGLDADGVAGPQTFRAMSYSAEDRVKQLAINLERWRWLPRNLGPTHVLVNQAGFELFMVKNGKTIDNRRVIVGKPYHQSPMFSDEIIYAEFNPTWTVPASIAGKEMLPKIRNNPNYLESKGYTLYTSWSGSAKQANPYAIDWSTVSSRKFPYRIVQGPGPRNALGRVKFIFPNKFSVYLHDTPSRSLFSRTGRAFSHGCIRVDKPLDFARKIYEAQGGLKPSKVSSIIESKKQTRVNLKRKLPVHLAYFTAWIDDDGIPLFFDDVYKRDRLVGKYLF